MAELSDEEGRSNKKGGELGSSSLGFQVSRADHFERRGGNSEGRMPPTPPR